MNPVQEDFDPELDGDDEEALINHAYQLLAKAASGRDQRSALVHWLKGAAIATDHLAQAHPFDSSPAEILIAALEALDGGTTYPVLLPTEVGSDERRLAGEIARAKARAVAAVQVLLELGATNVASAISSVAKQNGMAPSALKSLRLHVLAGKKYEEVRGYIAECEKEMRAFAEDFRGKSDGRRLFVFYMVRLLRKDRTYFGPSE